VTSKDELLKHLADAVIEGDEDKCAELAQESLDLGMDPYETIMKGCNKGMEIVSEKYEKKEMFVPEILLSADAMYAALELLRPHLKVNANTKKTGNVVIGVAEGDIHDIGKNLVLMMLDVAGYTIFDVGRDVSVDTFVQKAEEVDADIVAMSALMTTSMVRMGPVIEGLKNKGLKAKVIVGGAPISQNYADKIGADGYGKDAVEAVRVVNKLMEA